MSDSGADVCAGLLNDNSSPARSVPALPGDDVIVVLVDPNSYPGIASMWRLEANGPGKAIVDSRLSCQHRHAASAQLVSDKFRRNI